MKRRTWLDVYRQYFDGTAAPDEILHTLLMREAAEPGFEDRLIGRLDQLPGPETAVTLEEYRARLSREQRGALAEFERAPQSPELMAFELVEAYFCRLTADNSIYRK